MPSLPVLGAELVVAVVPFTVTVRDPVVKLLPLLVDVATLRCPWLMNLTLKPVKLVPVRPDVYS